MRLGARWRVGDPPHPSVPAALHAEIAAQEALRPQAQAWTLTWLEGRPRCELDGLVVVALSPEGRVTATALGEGAAGGTMGGAGSVPDDEDDDWLR